jgi:hypothetical protein
MRIKYYHSDVQRFGTASPVMATFCNLVSVQESACIIMNF